MKKIIYIIIIAFAVLAIPLFYRVHAADNTIPGQEIYYHLRAVETSGDTDTLVYNERPFYRFNYYYFLKGLSWLNLDVRIASVILGILSCVLLFLIISKISAETKTAFYALIMFALSPAFIYAFDTGSSETLCLFLILLGSLLLIGRKTHYFAIIPFILSIKNIFSVVIILAILFSFFMWKKERKISFTLMTAAVVTYAILIKPSFFVNYVYSELNTVAQMFSDIGGLYGISIFAAIFAILGFFFMKKRVYLYLLILVLIVSFFINNQTIIYANVLVCCFAGLGIKKIMEKKWKLSFLKDIMVYILLSGILVSAIYHINLLSTSQPSPQMMNAAKWLEKNSDKSSVVLSREENSYFIQYFGNKKVLYDSLSRYDKNFKTIKNDSEIIYHSRNLKVTEELLKKYGIRYILIDNEMLNRDVWEGPNDGLLFLLTNKEKFATVYNQGGIQIWYYTMV